MGSIFNDETNSLPRGWSKHLGKDGKPTYAFRSDGLSVKVLDEDSGAYVIEVPHMVKLERHVVTKAKSIFEAVDFAQRQFPDGDGEASCGLCKDTADGSDGRPFLVFHDGQGRPKRLCTKHAVEGLLAHEEQYRPECKEPGCARQVKWDSKTGYCGRHWRAARKAGKA